jgi:predicted metallo-beta-lactamase superfamily hydrolase
MRWGIDETVMDSHKQVYHGEENDEGCLLAVVVDAKTRQFR